ncbi:hypothetical protein SEA_GUDMIT_8 [Gordonia phage Gudmit]|nr:hypothetical protein SEA_GUDMIT_8 [Gordonia phage Gudmit]
MAVDIDDTVRGSGAASKTYEVEINGYATTVQLSDADAKARGLLKDEPKKSAPKKATPPNKARSASNKAAG